MKIQMKGIEVNELPYERAEMKHLVKLLKNPRTIVDVGANIGWYSIMLAKLYPKAKIYPIEPMPINFENLLENIEENGLKNIYPYECALSNKIGQNIFNYYPNFPAGSSMKNNIKIESVETVVETYLLDDFGHENIDFIKIDVEGNELMVLQGAVKKIKKYHPLIMCEMMRKWTHNFGYTPNDIIKFMKGLDYKCYAMGRCLELIKRVTNKTEETNFIFRR